MRAASRSSLASLAHSGGMQILAGERVPLQLFRGGCSNGFPAGPRLSPFEVSARAGIL